MNDKVVNHSKLLESLDTLQKSIEDKTGTPLVEDIEKANAGSPNKPPSNIPHGFTAATGGLSWQDEPKVRKALLEKFEKGIELTEVERMVLNQLSKGCKKTMDDGMAPAAEEEDKDDKKEVMDKSIDKSIDEHMQGTENFQSFVDATPFFTEVIQGHDNVLKSYAAKMDAKFDALKKSLESYMERQEGFSAQLGETIWRMAKSLHGVSTQQKSIALMPSSAPQSQNTPQSMNKSINTGNPRMNNTQPPVVQFQPEVVRTQGGGTMVSAIQFENGLYKGLNKNQISASLSDLIMKGDSFGVQVDDLIDFDTDHYVDQTIVDKAVEHHNGLVG